MFNRYNFLKRQLPIDIFPSGKFSNVEFPKLKLPNYILATVLAT